MSRKISVAIINLVAGIAIGTLLSGVARCGQPEAPLRPELTARADREPGDREPGDRVPS